VFVEVDAEENDNPTHWQPLNKSPHSFYCSKTDINKEVCKEQCEFCKNISEVETDEQILKMDFYDLCGSASSFMTDQEKIDWWRNSSEDKC
jgi:hypothetical protein